MTKSEQLKFERFKKVHQRRKDAKIHKQQGTFGKPFAKHNTVYGGK